MKDGLPLVVAYGGGVNSTAMLVEFHRRGIMPDLILFADTGGERPETYRTVWLVSEWCKLKGLPQIETVRANGNTLEEDSVERKALPSIAYGASKTCSQRWKTAPQDRRINQYLKSISPHAFQVLKAVGFDAGEPQRARQSGNAAHLNWFPLINWNLHRDDCEAICKSEGLPIAKSSCFFCPSMKKWEIVQLAQQHPDLAARAVAMERNAELTSIKGLGRDFAWGDFLKATAEQRELFCDIAGPEIPCGCYDG